MEPIPQSLASIAFLIRRCAHLRLEGRRNTSAQKRHEIAISRRSRLQSRDVSDCNLECPEAPRDTTSCSSSSCGTAPVRRPGACRSRGTRLACTCDEGAIRRSSEANQEAHFRRQARTQSRTQSRMQSCMQLGKQSGLWREACGRTRSVHAGKRRRPAATPKAPSSTSSTSSQRQWARAALPRLERRQRPSPRRSRVRRASARCHRQHS
jgi:hypothetical protein